MTEASPNQWVPGMPSPNPAGRPKGIIDKRQKLQAAFAGEAADIARVVIQKALDGDMQAANIALARIAPPIKAQAEKVQFALDSEAPLASQARQIMRAVSEGTLDADTARILIGCLNSVAGIFAVAELEQRVIELEAKEMN